MNYPAKWWETTASGRIRCRLCPRFCMVSDGQRGFCHIRQNQGGQLYLTHYGEVIGTAIDPIEKKPLYHFLPGSGILSFGTEGCSLGCRFCQNWEMSTANAGGRSAVAFTPEQIVDLAIRRGCPSIAYTYNEPIVFAEFLMDTAELAHQRGLRNVMVTNGYITPEARVDVFKHIDAANVDFKAFSEYFYRRLTASHLAPVLDTIVWLVKKTQVWIELTTLLIPGWNDADEDVERLVEWVKKYCGASVPMHFSAFRPDYRMLDTPATPPTTVKKARQIALKLGMRFVYTGNIHDENGSTTVCPSCGQVLIERGWMSSKTKRLKDGCCSCGERIEGVFI